jgi:hypothetical protein
MSTEAVTSRYAVDGVEHESNKIGAVISGYKKAFAERKLGEIPSEVVVWYDPQKPSDAYLKKHGPPFGYLIVVFATGLVGGALISIFAYA